MTPKRLWGRLFYINELNSHATPREEHCNTWYCYTDGSRHHNQTGYGYVVRKKGVTVSSSHDYLGTTATVFQAEV